MSGAYSRSKGSRAELAVVHALEARGIRAMTSRNARNGTQGGVDIICDLPVSRSVQTHVRYTKEVAGRCVNSPGRGHPRVDGGNVTHAIRKVYRLRTGRQPNTGYTDAERVLAFTSKADCSDPDGCWPWKAAASPVGYGRFWDGEKLVVSHRYAYELWVGPIPDGLTIDHLCGNPSCINPAHMEAVTHRENNLRGGSMAARHARKTHCKRGHEFTEENIYRVSSKPNARICKTCHNDRRRK